MFDTILVPLDGSPLASRVLPHVAAVAKAARARVVLFHAEPRLAEPTERSFDLDTVAAELAANGVAVETSTVPLAHQPIGEVILDAASDRGAGLIAMSTHGRSGLGRWLYGSVADQVLRRSTIPVLLVPASCERTPSVERGFHILVPLDGSDLAEEAIAPARDLAGIMRADVILLRVVETPVEKLQARTFVAVETVPEVQRAREYLESMATHFAPVARSVDYMADTGLPVPTIVNVARDERVDLIVMATHGYSGLARVVLGSVTTAVLQRGGTPMLVVRPRGIQQPRLEPAIAGQEAEPEPAGPPLTLTLNPREVQLVRVALEALLADSEREEHLAAPLHAILNKLPRTESAGPAGAVAASERPGPSHFTGGA